MIFMYKIYAKYRQIWSNSEWKKFTRVEDSERIHTNILSLENWVAIVVLSVDLFHFSHGKFMDLKYRFVT